MKSLLLIEDDLPKQMQITEVVRKTLGQSVRIDIATSMSSAIECIDGLAYDCILLDMSLPTFNEGQSFSSSGRQQDLAGWQILTYLTEMEICTEVFLITQLPDFVDEDGETVLLSDLHLRLEAEFPDLYAGYTYFHHSSDKWNLELVHFLQR